MHGRTAVAAVLVPLAEVAARRLVAPQPTTAVAAVFHPAAMTAAPAGHAPCDKVARMVPQATLVQVQQPGVLSPPCLPAAAAGLLLTSPLVVQARRLHLAAVVPGCHHIHVPAQQRAVNCCSEGSPCSAQLRRPSSSRAEARALEITCLIRRETTTRKFKFLKPHTPTTATVLPRCPCCLSELVHLVKPLVLNTQGADLHSRLCVSKQAATPAAGIQAGDEVV